MESIIRGSARGALRVCTRGGCLGKCTFTTSIRLYMGYLGEGVRPVEPSSGARERVELRARGASGARSERKQPPRPLGDRKLKQ